MELICPNVYRTNIRKDCWRKPHLQQKQHHPHQGRLQKPPTPTPHCRRTHHRPTIRNELHRTRQQTNPHQRRQKHKSKRRPNNRMGKQASAHIRNMARTKTHLPKHNRMDKTQHRTRNGSPRPPMGKHMGRNLHPRKRIHITQKRPQLHLNKSLPIKLQKPTKTPHTKTSRTHGMAHQALPTAMDNRRPIRRLRSHTTCSTKPREKSHRLRNRPRIRTPRSRTTHNRHPITPTPAKAPDTTTVRGPIHTPRNQP